MKVLTILRANGTTSRIQVEVPGAKSKKQPIVVPGSVVSAKKLDNGIGRIRITMFPGMVGVEVARDIRAAVRDLGCSRLIFDLRGNTGGGVGCIRLMSQLCAGKQGVGYSLTRKSPRTPAAIKSGWRGLIYSRHESRIVSARSCAGFPFR